MIESLCKKLRFLQAFLEDSPKNSINWPALRGLKREIRGVASKAESNIESQLYQLYLCYNEEEGPAEPCQSLHQTLQQLTRDIESFERRILQTESNHSVEPPRRNAAIKNIKADSSSKRSTVPKNVMGHHYLPLPKLVQGNLQTLSWLSLPQRLETEPDFKRIPNVKELGIHLMGYDAYNYKMHSLSKETWDLLPHISMEGLISLHQLENLKFETRQCSLKCDSKVLKAFPPNLKKLTLEGTNFSWEDMAIISTLLNLEVLKLRQDAFCGPEWKATGNGFCKLKYLEVTAHSTLQDWSVDADHFPILECIFLNDCRHLVEFPTGFGDINTLQLIHLKSCPFSLVTSAKKFQEERRDLGDDKLVLREFYTFSKVEIARRRSEGDKIDTV
nr:putative late blight resistance protein homolog R1C-3 isoform X3 [Ipomoea trifida]